MKKWSRSIVANWLQNNVGLVILVGFLAVITVINFPFGKWLTGWDNLHPEFDFGINFQRAINGVWMANQGLGHIGGHGYAANLIHTVVIWLLSIVIPKMSLRAVFTFLMYWLGVIGVWSWIKHDLGERDKRGLIALVSALYYAVNLATIQQFFFQLETFIIFFGFLPWILWSVQRYLSQPNLWFGWRFLILQLLFSAVGFLPPLFVVYGLGLVFFSLSFLITHPTKIRLTKVVLLATATVVINAYWLLPVGYYTINNAGDYLHSRNNALSTPGYKWQSIAYGKLSDVSLLKGFVWDTNDIQTDELKPVGYAMRAWRQHFNNPLIQGIGYLLFGLVLVGFVVSLYKRNWFYMGMGLWTLFGFTALAQAAYPFSLVANWLRDVPVINQAFRAAFTKVSIPLSLGYCFLIALALAEFRGWLRKFSFVYFSQMLAALSLLLVWFGSPLFAGQLLYSQLKQEIPTDYFSLFAFMKKQNSADRILVLPITWNWGWTNYQWGYTGSGFLWYGLQQPIVDRSFDSWSKYNEGLYEEFSSAFYQNDTALFQKLLGKYDIKWVLWDKSILNQSKVDPALQTRVNTFTQALSLTNPLYFGNLNLYSVGQQKGEFQWSTVPPSAHSTADYLSYDQTFDSIGTYMDTPDVAYPFTDLWETRSANDIYFGTKSVDIVRKLDGVAGQTMKVVLPEFKKNESVTFKVRVVRDPSTTYFSFFLSPVLPSLLLDQKSDITPSQQEYELRVISDTLPLPALVAVGDKVIAMRSVGSGFEGEETVDLPWSKPFVIYVPTSVAKNYQFENDLAKGWKTCQQPVDVSAAFVEQVIGNTVSATVKGLSRCNSVLFEELLPKEVRLISMDLGQRTTNLGIPKVCISKNDARDGVCYNDSEFFDSSETWRKNTLTSILNQPGQYWVDVIVRPGYDRAQTTTMDLMFNSVKVVAARQLLVDDAEMWNVLNPSQIILVKRTGAQTIVAHYTDAAEISLPLDRLLDYRNCNLQSDADLVASKKSADGIVLSAQNTAVGCVSLPLHTTSLQDQGILRMQGGVLEGKGLDFSITDRLIQRETKASLFDEKKFDTSFALMRNGEQNSYADYDLNFKLWTFPSTSTVVNLNQLGWYPLPLKWLSRIKVVYGSEKSLGVSPKNGLKIQQSASWYKVIRVGLGEGLVTLNQGFDKGWIGFQNWKKLEHTKVNGWANGWVVSEEGDVTIFYWPQMLEWLGLAMLIISPCVWLTQKQFGRGSGK